MVIAREGYKVYIAADGYNWSFRSRGPPNFQFCCVIRPSKYINSSYYTDPSTDITQLRSRIERDIAITISLERNRRRKKVALDVFKR